MFFPCFPAHRRAGGAAILPVITLAALLGTGSASAGPLTNGDFSAGFDGWSGEVFDLSGPVAVDPLPGAYSGNFSTGPAGATLTTSYGVDEVYDVIMYQRFVVDTLAPGFTGLALLLDITYFLSDPDDTVIAQLFDPNGVLATKDLLGGGPVDITEYAGRMAEILFQVTDFDDVAEVLTVGNIRIEQVPVPAPLALLTLGLGLLAGRGRFLSRQVANQE
jgi:hypothetical protein